MNIVRNWVKCMDMWLVIESTEAEHYSDTQVQATPHMISIYNLGWIL